MALFDFIQNDRRIVDQRLRKHQLSQTEYLKYLKNLPDDKEQIEEASSFGLTGSTPSHRDVDLKDGR